MTQVELSEQTGYSVSAIYQWEADLRMPSFEVVCHLADTLGVPIQAFREEADAEGESKK